MNENRISSVLVGLSGGVDSAVAAALLRDAGWSVETVTLRLAAHAERSAAGEDAGERAAAVASALGVPHRELDCCRAFERCVIAGFVSEYSRGRTPNPWVMCNPDVKFSALLEEANRSGIDFVATGHYARVARDPDTGRFCLERGLDPEKDQSYFLHRLNQAQLARLHLPLGRFTKSQVRARAQALGLPAAQRPGSQEICFIPEGRYTDFLRARIPGAFRPGPILDLEGRPLGSHQGIAHFTVGQRRGLGIAAPDPLYVIEIHTADNTVVAGPEEALYRRELEAEAPHWISGAGPSGPLSVRAQIRYRHGAAAAVVEPSAQGGVRVRFESPQRAVTPGQAVVFYREPMVLGGAKIASTRPPDSKEAM
jgi:tRNA-uridine 2-sulfurtransferase